VTDLYTVRIPDWSDGRHLDLTNIEADGPEGATAKAVEWVNRRAGYHYCDRLPAGTTVRRQTRLSNLRVKE
jgi:hypothetical protein